MYKAKTKSMVMDTKNVYADRGRIMDRNGIVFADNYRDTANRNLDYSRIFLQGKLPRNVWGRWATTVLAAWAWNAVSIPACVATAVSA